MPVSHVKQWCPHERNSTAAGRVRLIFILSELIVMDVFSPNSQQDDSLRHGCKSWSVHSQRTRHSIVQYITHNELITISE